MTIEEIRALTFNPAARKREKEAEISNLMAEEISLKQKAERASEQGNNEEYLSAHLSLDATQRKIKELITALDDPRPAFDTEEVKEVWNKHIAKRNADFDKKFAEYKAARHALCDQFIELARMQQETLKDMRHVKSLVRTKKEAAEDSWGIGFPKGMKKPHVMRKNSFFSSMKYEGYNVYPDLAFFVDSGELSRFFMKAYNDDLQTCIY